MHHVAQQGQRSNCTGRSYGACGAQQEIENESAVLIMISPQVSSIHKKTSKIGHYLLSCHGQFTLGPLSYHQSPMCLGWCPVLSKFRYIQSNSDTYVPLFPQGRRTVCLLSPYQQAILKSQSSYQMQCKYCKTLWWERCEENTGN
jgi:hypothetical protein